MLAPHLQNDFTPGSTEQHWSDHVLNFPLHHGLSDTNASIFDGLDVDQQGSGYGSGQVQVTSPSDNFDVHIPYHSALSVHSIPNVVFSMPLTSQVQSQLMAPVQHPTMASHPAVLHNATIFNHSLALQSQANISALPQDEQMMLSYMPHAQSLQQHQYDPAMAAVVPSNNFQHPPAQPFGVLPDYTAQDSTEGNNFGHIVYNITTQSDAPNESVESEEFEESAEPTESEEDDSDHEGEEDDPGKWPEDPPKNRFFNKELLQLPSAEYLNAKKRPARGFSRFAKSGSLNVIPVKPGEKKL